MKDLSEMEPPTLSDVRRRGVASGGVRLLRAYNVIRGERSDDVMYNLLPKDRP